ncbi:MAG: class I mannose-6-phosphate isomerase [Bryobacteraceae bacterium]|nr:class I mannose-6-phosphate isomerase [Bryobacteraceae bacterium]
MVRRLEPAFYEKVWGAHRLAPWFEDTDKKIGEVWFHDREALPLLLKFIFTTERLSVQVHPDDDYARQHENSNGKTEMWHILRADPGATIALGFKEPLAPDRLREASLSGEIEHLLNWVPVQPGETYFVCAGTVHAIGSGIALAEIQQYSDVTYRLYDYGRPRELHLEKGFEVSRMNPHPGAAVAVGLGDGLERLVVSPFFLTDRVTVAGNERRVERGALGADAWIAIEGSGLIEGQPFRAGEVFLAEGDVTISGHGRLLRTAAPAA